MPLLGNAYFLLFCGTAAGVMSLGCLLFRTSRLRAGSAEFLCYGGLFISPGILAVLLTTFVRPNNLQFSVQQLVFGYAVPLLCFLALFSMNEREQRQAWVAFYTGWCLFFAGSIILLVLSWRAATDGNSFFADLEAGQKLVAWRYTFGEPWNVYSAYVGNANKESNYILMFLLFSTHLLGTDEVGRKGRIRSLYFIFWICSLATLLLLFSRAAIFLLPLVIYVSGFLSQLSRRTKWISGAAVVSVAIAGYEAFSRIVAYLLTSTYSDEVSGGVLGTFNERFDLWRDIYSYLMRHTAALVTGLGTGGYGDLFFAEPRRGTHNMFIDTLLESGVVGFTFLVLLVLFVLLHCIDFRLFRVRNKLCLAAMAVLVLLMFREHSLAYLYMTSLGGMCFTLIFFCLSVRESTMVRSAGHAL